MKKGNVILDIGNGNCVFNGREWVVTTNDAPASDPRLIVTYNVDDDSEPTLLFAGADSYGFPASAIYDKIEIDGVEIDMDDLSKEGEDMTSYLYLLSSGEHTIRYALKDPTFIGIEFDEQTRMPSKIGATFDRCSSIASVEIPSNVTGIGGGAFEYCSGLTSVTIPSSVTTIGGAAFQFCTGLTSVTIPSSVTTIGEAAFQFCTGLPSVTIPNSVTSISSSAFYGCSGLTSVTIPDSVTSIGSSAFASCSSLTSVTIGNSVTSIGSGVFYNCSGLASITSLATTAPSIQNGTFQNVKTNGTLTVPIGSSGYNVWMGTGNFYLGKYNWTKVEQ